MNWDHLERVGGIDGGSGWSWYVFDILYDQKDGVFYGYEDAGCSCNYPYEDDWEPTTGPMSRTEAIKHVNDRRTDDPEYGTGVGDYIDLAKKVRKHRK